MGYNLAIEYLADYEKTWMLDSFRVLNERVLVPQQRGLSEWLFLEVTNFSFYSVTLSYSRHVILPISCQAFPNAARIHPTMPESCKLFQVSCCLRLHIEQNLARILQAMSESAPISSCS